MRKITLKSILGPVSQYYGSNVKGAFYATSGVTGGAAYPNDQYGYGLDISRIVPTDSEGRPINIGKTPLIYLGV